MKNTEFTVLILTFNEELNIERLLLSIKDLNARTCVLDSGSTDRTLDILKTYGCEVAHHAFENHPKQWDKALELFDVQTPWTIGLDADQEVLPELYSLLRGFKDEALSPQINGIYFNRKYFFKGRWLKHGGYFPRYLLKMFRTGKGYSDLKENMDHRFVVEGESQIWKTGYIKEENFKENQIDFWLKKHNRYSDLTAEEEFERRQNLRSQTVQPSLWGSPDQKMAVFKKLWWKMPLFVRPLLYFIYRYFFQLGFLDGKQGLIFHFLQALWFRFVVDIKIEELQEKGR